MSEIEEEFADIRKKYYPGSKKERKPATPPQPPQQEVVSSVKPWVLKPRYYKMPDGTTIELFTIGALAVALNREPVTIRMWEREGIIPRANFRSSSGQKARRLYTRDQIEGIVQIAKEEGIIGDDRPKTFASTRFTARVWELFGAPPP